jgi:hypothetical protein
VKVKIEKDLRGKSKMSERQISRLANRRLQPLGDLTAKAKSTEISTSRIVGAPMARVVSL